MNLFEKFSAINLWLRDKSNDSSYILKSLLRTEDSFIIKSFSEEDEIHR